MKKIISLLLALLLFAGIFTGCGGKQTQTPHRLSVVVTIFPLYDWVMHILGDAAGEAEVTLLLDNGVDLHSYQPTADDIIRISRCDLFLYVGGNSDKWVPDALRGATNPDRTVLDLLSLLGAAAKTEEVKEGMQEEEEEEEGPEYDEHVWLSLKNAALFTGKIAEALAGLDPGHAELFSANAASYTQKLNALDESYRAAVREANGKTLLFADRFPFRYLADDYALDYYAAFAGCSAESEASFETVAFLAGKVDELHLSAVLTLEGSDHRIAETVVSTATAKGVRILSMDSMQSVTSTDVKKGADYLTIMEKNLAVLKEALQ